MSLSFFLESLSPQLSLSPQEPSFSQLPQPANEVEVDATEARETTRPSRRSARYMKALSRKLKNIAMTTETLTSQETLNSFRLLMNYQAHCEGLMPTPYENPMPRVIRSRRTWMRFYLDLHRERDHDASYT